MGARESRDSREHLERLLPHNTDAEAGVVGSCLIDADVLPSVMGRVKPEAFYHEKYRVIYNRMVELYNGGTAPDLITLSDELERHGELETVGGHSGLSGMATQVPTSANAEYYAAIVTRTYVLRQQIEIYTNGVAQAYVQEEPDRIIAGVVERLARLSAHGSKLRPRDFAEIMDEAWAEVEETGRGVIPPGVYTGHAQLDEHTMGFRRKEMVVIAGRPGTFKSTVGAAFCMAEALRQAELRASGHEYGKVLWVSLEMSRTQQANRVLSAHASVNTRQIRGGFRLPNGDIHHAAKESYRQAYLALRPRVEGILEVIDEPLSLSQLRQVVMTAVAEGNLKALFLDQFDLLEPEEWATERRQAELERLNSYARGLKQLSMAFGITSYVLVQLNRASVGETRPGLHNLAGTDRLGRDADAVIMTHYDRTIADDFLELALVKMRDGQGGVMFGAKVEAKYSRITAWPGTPATWPEDPSRKLQAPRDEDKPYHDTLEEPAPVRAEALAW